MRLALPNKCDLTPQHADKRSYFLVLGEATRSMSAMLTLSAHNTAVGITFRRG
jgi:hypothetical protein